MKKIALAVLLSALLARSAAPQSAQLQFKVVAPTSLGTVTSSQNNFEQNKAATITLTSSTSGFNASCTAKWDATSVTVSYSATTLKLTATITAAMTNAPVDSLHTFQIDCTPAPLALLTDPVTLPAATVGASYSADVGQVAKVSGGKAPYVFSLAAGAVLPPGLSFASSGVLSGRPTLDGCFNFGYKVTDAAGSSVSGNVGPASAAEAGCRQATRA